MLPPNDAEPFNEADGGGTSRTRAIGAKAETGHVDFHLQLKMREAMTNHSSLFDPLTMEGCFFQGPLGFWKSLDPGAKRRLEHAPQQSLFWPSHQIDGATAVQRYEGGAPLQGPRPFRRFARQLLGNTPRAADTMPGEGARAAERALWHADRGAEVHERLGKVARTLFRHQRRR
jgi:hypothetical protein